ncbi:transporter [Dactylosporangium sp. NPDC049525]|uniref:transporter n=1 Tax=Dactylosporangium sp. NPDC049525 TaxID=3154730 RepID=UPI00343B1981
MIWLTWRQHRRQALFTLLGFVALAAFVVPTGLSMRHAYDRLSLAGCDGGTACAAKLDEFTNTYGALVFVSVLMLTLPLVVGLFWGAPVVAREVEHGTHRMIWTQGISRRHWALSKTALLGGAVVVLAVVYGAGMSWWYAPLGRVDFRQNRFTQIFFDMQGIAPVGYTLFAVALGLFAGTVLPKVLPAMTATLAGFVAVRVAVTVLARPHYMSPVSRTESIFKAPGSRDDLVGDWVLAKSTHQADGTFVASGTVRCPAPDNCAAVTDFGLRPGAYNALLVQPADRFWAFQWIETGIFVALAALLVWFAVRRIRRIA